MLAAYVFQLLTEIEIFAIASTIATVCAAIFLRALRSVHSGERAARKLYCFVVAASLLALLYDLLAVIHVVKFSVVVFRPLSFRF